MSRLKYKKSNGQWAYADKCVSSDDSSGGGGGYSGDGNFDLYITANSSALPDEDAETITNLSITCNKTLNGLVDRVINDRTLKIGGGLTANFADIDPSHPLIHSFYAAPWRVDWVAYLEPGFSEYTDVPDADDDYPAVGFMITQTYYNGVSFDVKYSSLKTASMDWYRTLETTTPVTTTYSSSTRPTDQAVNDLTFIIYRNTDGELSCVRD